MKTTVFSVRDNCYHHEHLAADVPKAFISQAKEELGLKRLEL